MKNRLFVLCLTGWLSLAGRALAETPPVVAIKNARIVTVSGPVIAKGTVVIRNGLIEAVGDSVQEPADAWVINGEGLTVYPGLIDALSTWGLPGAQSQTASPSGRRGFVPEDPAPAPTPAPPGRPTTLTTPSAPPARGPEDRPYNTSFLLAADQLDPADRRLESARGAGFTGAVCFPNRGIFAGQGAVINLAGQRAGSMVVQSPAGLYLTLRGGGSFGGGFPGSLMGVIAYIRQIYLDADHYQKAKELYAASPLGNKRPDYDKTLEGVLAAPRVLMPAQDPKEIARMLRFAGELKLKAVLYGVHEGYRAADILSKYDAAVLVNLRWPEKSRDADPEAEDSFRMLELRDKAPSTPAALAKAGVKFAFYLGGLDRSSDIARSVRRSLDAGLPQAAAVRALTLGPAEIFGVADRLGSIEKGKIANLIVTSGELFQEKTEVKYVFVDGVKFEPSPEAPPALTEVSR
ncbi:MAG: amidohydrolase family protein [Acidobacteria bacterium]|nr:amidohydrolase family protein [Acidobacteriota bacterium]